MPLIGLDLERRCREGSGSVPERADAMCTPCSGSCRSPASPSSPPGGRTAPALRRRHKPHRARGTDSPDTPARARSPAWTSRTHRCMPARPTRMPRNPERHPTLSSRADRLPTPGRRQHNLPSNPNRHRPAPTPRPMPADHRTSAIPDVRRFPETRLRLAGVHASSPDEFTLSWRPRQPLGKPVWRWQRASGRRCWHSGSAGLPSTTSPLITVRCLVPRGRSHFGQDFRRNSASVPDRSANLASAQRAGPALLCTRNRRHVEVPSPECAARLCWSSRY